MEVLVVVVVVVVENFLLLATNGRPKVRLGPPCRREVDNRNELIRQKLLRLGEEWVGVVGCALGLCGNTDECLTFGMF